MFITILLVITGLITDAIFVILVTLYIGAIIFGVTKSLLEKEIPEETIPEEPAKSTPQPVE